MYYLFHVSLLWTLTNICLISVLSLSCRHSPERTVRWLTSLKAAAKVWQQMEPKTLFLIQDGLNHRLVWLVKHACVTLHSQNKEVFQYRYEDEGRTFLQWEKFRTGMHKKDLCHELHCALSIWTDHSYLITIQTPTDVCGFFSSSPKPTRLFWL